MATVNWVERCLSDGSRDILGQAWTLRAEPDFPYRTGEQYESERTAYPNISMSNLLRRQSDRDQKHGHEGYSDRYRCGDLFRHPVEPPTEQYDWLPKDWVYLF